MTEEIETKQISSLAVALTHRHTDTQRDTESQRHTGDCRWTHVVARRVSLRHWRLVATRELSVFPPVMLVVCPSLSLTRSLANQRREHRSRRSLAGALPCSPHPHPSLCLPFARCVTSVVRSPSSSLLTSVSSSSSLSPFSDGSTCPFPLSLSSVRHQRRPDPRTDRCILPPPVGLCVRSAVHPLQLR